MSAKPQRLNEEPYMGKLFVRFREGPGSNLPGLLEDFGRFYKKLARRSPTRTIQPVVECGRQNAK